jgi:hypothetical protein
LVTVLSQGRLLVQSGTQAVRPGIIYTLKYAEREIRFN